MALPTLSKTWRYARDIINLGAFEEAWHDEYLLTYIRELTAQAGHHWGTVPTGIWSVNHSCDSFTAGVVGDGVNRWIDAGDIVHRVAGQAHSWMVLNTGLNGGAAQMCIDVNGSSGTQSTITQFFLSYSGGFSGGTTTARPTASDEFKINLNANNWTPYASTATNVRTHIWMSDDGAELRMLMIGAGIVAQQFLFCGEIENPRVAHTSPIWGGLDCVSASQDQISHANLNGFIGRSHQAGAVNSEFLIRGTATKGVGSTLMLDDMITLEEMDSQAVIERIGLYADGTQPNGTRGPKGAIKDLYWGLDINPSGDTYPDDASRQFTQVSALVFPNDGTVLNLTQP